ncbi:MAG: cytochrome c oxidase subunit 3 [Acidobacteria bacterium]|nr:cytochrome c oxidase subunit 3 [Acidobacteriota bacterium]
MRTFEAVGVGVETVDMSELVTRQVSQIRAGGEGGGRPAEGFGDFGRGDGFPPGHARRVYRTGMYLALVGISMLFIAFTSAYIVRSGLGDDWAAMSLPPLLWWNTALLILSSFTMEQTSRTLSQGPRTASNGWVTATAILGLLFLTGQMLAWRQLAGNGIYLATNPSSSFFYLLTGAHAVHLTGGLMALFYITLEAWRYRLGPAKRTLVEVTAIYWHFMAGLWVYILLLLWWWR